MKPRSPLMVEHRLIEQMLAVINDQRAVMLAKDNFNPIFIDAVADFFKTYADRTHHGKEEEIFFKALATKNMSPEDRKAMQELIEEHKFARKKVTELLQAKEDFLAGKNGALKTLKTLLESLTKLVEFYPEHIRREDEVFFPDTEKYFTKAELDAMLKEFWEFDKKMIHEKYQRVVEHWKLALPEN
jgi:hemerythrin-like domain-containing protein